jgi:hypothetical protein
MVSQVTCFSPIMEFAMAQSKYAYVMVSIYFILLLKICEQIIESKNDPRHFFRPSTFYPRPRPITLDPRPLVKLITIHWSIVIFTPNKCHRRFNTLIGCKVRVSIKQTCC